MDHNKPANPYYAPADGSRPGEYIAPPVAPRRNTLALVLGGIGIFILAFVMGIFFTIIMQTRYLGDTPLAFIQKPILDLSGIPSDAHKEWLALQQSFGLADKYFYDQKKINHKEMIYHAAEAAVESLGDRFTAYNRPVTAKANSDFIKGVYVGVGIVPEIRDGVYVVNRLIDDSPVARAGVKENDLLVAIDGERLPDKIVEVEPITKKLQGEVGTKIKLTFRRPSDNNRETEYELTRTQLIRPSVDARLLPNNIVYIEMKTVFGENTMKEFDQKVGSLAKDNPAGYILDMRDNGGGSVETARQLLGRFLENGVAYYEDAPAVNKHMLPVEVANNGSLKLFDKSLVVLVNGNSASATEITAAALHDRQRAKIIGEKTYGKGSAQYVLPLEGDSALRVTFEHWFTPNKVNLYDSKGIQPDIQVVPTEDERKQGKDPQLDRAVQELLNKS